MADELLARIRADCALSVAGGGQMPIEIVVADDAAKARAQKLLRGRHGNRAVSIVTEAELALRIRGNLRRWRRAGLADPGRHTAASGEP